MLPTAANKTYAMRILPANPMEAIPPKIGVSKS
jgi:hypothetical protein